MKRTHITNTPIKSIRTNRQPQTVDSKPRGFWYGVDGDWERWCRAEEFGLSGEMLEYELILGSERMLTLSNVLDIDIFHEQYKAQLPGMSYFYNIDWSRVTAEYDGIKIAPYQWERRLHGEAHSWYYVWDCASGCIWRPKGVKLRLLKNRVVAGEPELH